MSVPSTPAESASHEELRLYWDAVISCWEKSNLRQSEFCDKYGLSRTSFSKWKSKLPAKRKQYRNGKALKDVWNNHLKQWQQSGLSQIDYCAQYKLSPSTFSRWKNKLSPEKKSKIKTSKNMYGARLKVPEYKVVMLVKLFLAGISRPSAAKLVLLNRKTVSKYYREFNMLMLNGAFHYPQLFSGAGAVVMLGENPITSKLDLGKRLSNFTEINKEIIRASIFRWSLPETYILVYKAMTLNYKYIYAPKHGLDPNIENPNIMGVKAEKSFSVIAKENRDFEVQNRMEFLMELYDWMAVFHGRKYSDAVDVHEQNIKDLLWIIRNNPIKSSKYFIRLNDYFKIIPSRKEVQSHWDRFEQYKKAFKDGSLEFQVG